MAVCLDLSHSCDKVSGFVSKLCDSGCSHVSQLVTVCLKLLKIKLIYLLFNGLGSVLNRILRYLDMLLHQPATFERNTDGAITIQCSVCFFSGFSMCKCNLQQLKQQQQQQQQLRSPKFVQSPSCDFAKKLIFSGAFSTSPNCMNGLIDILLKGQECLDF